MNQFPVHTHTGHLLSQSRNKLLQIFKLHRLESRTILYSYTIYLLNSFELQESPNTIWPNICPSTPPAVPLWHNFESSSITKLLASNKDDLIQRKTKLGSIWQTLYFQLQFLNQTCKTNTERMEEKEKKKKACNTSTFLIPKHSGTGPNLFLKFQVKISSSKLTQRYREW